jgi:hypothetical protein
MLFSGTKIEILIKIYFLAFKFTKNVVGKYSMKNYPDIIINEIIE